MNAYSKDLRMRVLATVDRGIPREEIVRVFGVSLATVGRWLRRRRETGDVDARPSPGHTRRICSKAEERRALWAQLEAHPEATLEEHREAVGARGRRAGLGGHDEPGDPPARLTYKQRRWQPPSATRRPEPAGASG